MLELADELIQKHIVAHVEDAVEKEQERIYNKLYNALPVGNVDAFELMKQWDKAIQSLGDK